MIPIVTPDEMRAIDAAAPESVEVLIGRAGWATARTARRMLGGTYGKVVTVVAGKGNNGADGRVAADVLARAGAKVTVLDAATSPDRLGPCDLVIDAAYGTGFHGDWPAPEAAGAPVLAVDIPSGVDGLTGAASGRVMAAQRTVTFAAVKPGLLLGAGRGLAGDVEMVPIGLDTSGATAHVVEAADVAHWLRPRPAASHKWRAAVRIVAGSAGMTGSAQLASHAAMRAGAGMVGLSVPGAAGGGATGEVVGRPVSLGVWATAVGDGLDRYGAVVLGPGLGRDDETVGSIRALVASAPIPLVVDADGLAALGTDHTPLHERTAPTILTPHEGEFAQLIGAQLPADRFAAVRALAASTGAIVLLKGPVTVIADRSGRVRVMRDGDARLATAGTGDVLSGILGALLATGLDPLDAASTGAWLHAAAANRRPACGLVAGDLLDALPGVFAGLAAPADGRGTWRSRR